MDAAWRDAAAVADLVAVDPAGLGALVAARPGPARDIFLAALGDRLDAPPRKVPIGVGADRLLGGLDVAASLRLRRPVMERGLLAEIDGGVALLPLAERLAPETVALLLAAFDRNEVVLERDGLAARFPTRFGLIALKEGDEDVAAGLADRLAFRVPLDGLRARPDLPPADRGRIGRARRALPRVQCSDDLVGAVAETADRLGIRSPRAALLALAAARAAAALAGRDRVAEADAALAVRLVLAPRATCVPPPPAEPEQAPPDDADGETQREQPDGATEVLVEAARATLPPELLDGAATASRTAAGRGEGAARTSRLRGRPLGVRAGSPQGARVSVIETLKAAAPWQTVRGAPPGTMLVHADDIRIRRFRDRRQSLTIFVVDASGSVARARLAEAKGAVELLLGRAYARRDLVALVAFRGTGADLLLPPTRSLARARRLLAALPGGGATPLGAGLDAALGLAETARRSGQSATVVLIGDGRANVARGAVADRAAARAEALAAAARLWSVNTVVLDTSVRPGAEARALADAAHARYVWMPRSDAVAIRDALEAPPTA